MTAPHPSNTHRLANQLDAAASFLRKHGDTATRIARQEESPLRASSTVGKSTTHSDPTPTAALTHDPTRRLHQRLTDAMRHADTAICDLVAVLHECLPADDRAVTPDDRGIPACGNIHGCPDEAWSDNDRGRCRPCATHLRRHGTDRTARQRAS